MDKRLHSPMNSAGESGAALITGLIFLVVLTMIGVTAAKMAGLEERMSGNLRDRSLAMQAAEMALRYAERDILYSGRFSGLSGFTADCGVSTVTTEDDGLCWNGKAGYGLGTPAWYEAKMDIAGAYVEYGQAPFLPAILAIPLVSPPRYLIEGIENTPPGGSLTTYYRITVRAQGAYARTTVWLQEVFAP